MHRALLVSNLISRWLKLSYFIWLLPILTFLFFIKPFEPLSCKPISIAAHVWLGYEPMFLARRENWLDSQQVTILETASATASIQALIDDKVDGAALTLDEVLKVREMGLPLTVVMVFNISAGADKLLARKEITTLSELKGKRLGYESGSVGEVLLAEILNRADLSKRDMHLYPIPVDKHHEVWSQGTLDAIITYEPTATLLLAESAHQLFDTSQTPNLIVDVLAIRTDRLDYPYAKSIQHLISSHFRALRHFQYNPNDAAYRIAGHLQLNNLEVLAAYKGLVLPDLLFNHRLLDRSSAELSVTTQHLADVMVNGQLLKHEQNFSELFDSSYLPTMDIFE
ncbi:MAG: ABC transporter substrate-binding protein [Methylotenera sp.]|nr:ABC transporter substrate-binding protein [Methylotenera sp.]